jgi:long-chain acyl-CoA synthetase
MQADKVFLYAPENQATLSYGQLAKEAHHFSTWLDEQGVSAHGHVGLYMQNGRQTSTIFLASMACGRVIAPPEFIPPAPYLTQLAWVLDHSDIEVLFYSPARNKA